MMTTAPAWAPTCTASPEGKTQTRSYLIQTASERQSATIGPQRRQADIETHTEALKPRLPCNQIASIEINTTQKKKKCFWLHGLEVTLVKNEVWQKRKPLLRAHVHISFWGQKSAWELREKNTAPRLVSVITIPWQPWHCPFAVLIDIRTSVARRTWVHDIICMRQITLNINASAGKNKTSDVTSGFLKKLRDFQLEALGTDAQKRRSAWKNKGCWELHLHLLSGCLLLPQHSLLIGNTWNRMLYGHGPFLHLTSNKRENDAILYSPQCCK